MSREPKELWTWNKKQIFIEANKIFFLEGESPNLKFWKRSKFPVIVTWKHADLSNGGLFWKSWFLEEPALFLLDLKWNLLEAFSCVKAKTNSNFTVNLAARSSYLFSVYLKDRLSQISVIFNVIMECIELKRKH